MMEALLSLIIGALFVGFFWMARHIRRNRGQLESLGIPINKPGFILGSPPYALHKLHHHTEQLEKFKQFGKTYGSYSGAIPTINTIDPDLIKSICLKNADSFDRNFSIDAPDKYNTIDISHGVVWHSLRKVLSPTFTSGKLKAMMEPMENIADEMVEQVGKVIKQTGSNVLDVKDLFVNLAMNVIGQCGFGVKIDAYNRPDEPLILHGKKIFEGFKVSNWITVIVFSLFDFFPSISKVIPIWPEGTDQIRDISINIMNEREKAGITGTADFLSRIATLIKSKEENANDEVLQHLNEEILNAQSITFFTAGFETTANTLSLTSYNLAKFPTIQEKLLQEIKSAMNRHDDVLSYDTITDIEYLDAVINESLRINGPVLMHVRTCTKDCEVLPGMTVKKGTQVMMPIYAAHHCPEFFPQPEEFRPERFLSSSEVIPYTFRPFGAGLRLCIAQRFALNEIKVALVKLMLEYKFCIADETKLDLNKGDTFFYSYPEMKLRLERRK